MLSENDINAINIIKSIRKQFYENKQETNLTCYDDMIIAIDTVLNLITKLQREIEHQKEKREHQKVELAILNERQKEMNKLKNTVNSYYGMFKKQEKVIREIQKENEEKDKQIDLTTKALSAVCTGISSVREQLEKSYCEFINSDKDCCWKTDKSCKDCIFEYFKKLAKEKGE